MFGWNSTKQGTISTGHYLKNPSVYSLDRQIIRRDKRLNESHDLAAKNKLKRPGADARIGLSLIGSPGGYISNTLYSGFMDCSPNCTTITGKRKILLDRDRSPADC